MGNNVLYICVCDPRLAYRNSNWTGSKLCFRCRAVFSVRGLLTGARIGPSRILVVGAKLCFRSGVCLTELELDRLEIWFPMQICVFCPGLLTGAGIWPVGAELCFRSGVCLPELGFANTGLQGCVCKQNQFTAFQKTKWARGPLGTKPLQTGPCKVVFARPFARADQ